MNFFRTSSPAPTARQPHLAPSMDRSTTSASTRSTSSRSSDMSTGSAYGEADVEEKAGLAGTAVAARKQEKVYVAVGKEVKDWKANLLWVLQNIPRHKMLVILHIYCPAKNIPFMGGYFPADQLHEDEVAAFRNIEIQTMNKSLMKYQTMCARVKIQANKLMTEMDNVAEGIVMLIAQRGITELIMGAAADKHYNKKMKAPTSKTALNVQQQADPLCKIWFLCKGNLICTREAASSGYDTPMSHAVSSNSTPSQTENHKTRPLPEGQVQLANLLESFTNESIPASFDSRGDPSLLPGSRSDSFDLHRDLTTVPSADTTLGKSTAPGSIVIDLWDGISRKNSHVSEHIARSMGNNSSSSMDGEAKTKSMENYGRSLHTAPGALSEPEQKFSSPHHYLKEVGTNNDMHNDFQNILTEAEKLRREAYMESLRRPQHNVHQVSQNVKTADNSDPQEMIYKNTEVNTTRSIKGVELEDIRREREDIYEELQKAHEQRAQLELQVINSNRIIKDLQEKLSEAHCLLFSLEREQEELRQERDNVIKEAEQLRDKVKELEQSRKSADNFSEFSYAELKEATNNFDESLKIGEGGYGSVYKGVLRHTTVAIKLLNPQGMQGKSEFHKEMDVLSKVRHPNLVTLIGACSEAWALVYEFLPNGSLEDRLACKDNTPPLSWQARTHIAAEICSALIFLHQREPLTVIHGDLKPANILLDANFVSRLGDFGICRLLESNANTILFRCTHPMGTFVYMDPEFLASGELRPCSDVYSFGIILLRLLTGRPAMGIINQVNDALDEGRLGQIVDASAGDWPYEQAKQLAELGVKCCEIKRKNRPDLAGEAWKILESLAKAS